MKILPMLICLFVLAACGNAPVDPLLIGGTPADPKEWPASVYASMSGSRCSATVVGDRALLIASHCVSNGGKATFSVGSNAYSATCTHHPDYTRNSTADWTMCVIDKPVTGVAFEMINIDPNRVKMGMNLRLTGYGCVKPGGGGGNDGIFRIGEAPVVGLPSGSNHDITTKGKSALCFGDSGGAAYVETGAYRWVVGVNSRGDISTTSYLPALHDATKFIADWAKSKSVEVCGVTANPKGCRAVADPIPLPVDFSVDGRAGFCAGKVKPGYESALTEIVARLKSVLDSAN